MEKDLPGEYQKGFTKFLGCRIDLRKRVLIPRLETAFWAKEAIKEIEHSENASRHIKVLDMFAGSGCIGIAVLKKTKNSQVEFVDMAKSAVEQIRINLKINKISPKRYKIRQSNLFEKLKENKYHFILANPPYVARERIKEVQPSVLKYEPKEALFSGKKGLEAIKRFLKEARRHLKKSGIIYMEFDPLQKKDIELILIKEKYKKIEFNKDQFNQWRWLKLRV